MKRILTTAAVLFALLVAVQPTWAQAPSVISNIPAIGGGVGSASSQLIPGHMSSAASTNSKLWAAGNHSLFQYNFINSTATPYYWKLYNKATAPTCGTDTPVKVITVPANASNWTVVASEYGLQFPLGLGSCLTGALTDSDTTNAATGVSLDIGYK